MLPVVEMLSDAEKLKGTFMWKFRGMRGRLECHTRGGVHLRNNLLIASGHWVTAKLHD